MQVQNTKSHPSPLPKKTTKSQETHNREKWSPHSSTTPKWDTTVVHTTKTNRNKII